MQENICIWKYLGIIVLKTFWVNMNSRERTIIVFFPLLHYVLIKAEVTVEIIAQWRIVFVQSCCKVWKPRKIFSGKLPEKVKSMTKRDWRYELPQKFWILSKPFIMVDKCARFLQHTLQCNSLTVHKIVFFWLNGINLPCTLPSSHNFYLQL